MKRYKLLLKAAKDKLGAAQAILDAHEGKDLPAEKSAEFDKLTAEADELRKRASQAKAIEEADAEIAEALDGADGDEDEDEEDGDEEPKSRPGPSAGKNGVIGGRQSKSFGPVYAMRFGEESKAQQALLTDLVGADYQQTLWAQAAAFTKYLRFGELGLDRNEAKLLKLQVFPWSQIEHMAKLGLSAKEMKTVMVEAQGSLGGFAVPPQVQQGIITRLPGLTAVRGGGARVVDLINGNGIDAPKYTGGTDQYRGNIRGAWGAETATPGAQNATLGQETIVANVYTYKVGFSQSLVEDAANLVELVQADITDVLAIDEDTANLVGDGVGKPQGILPNSANDLTLTHVHSGHATLMTADGVKALKRGVASQYRANCSFIGNSDTFGAIERLVDGAGAYIFDDLSDTDRLLNRPIRESESMPDIAGSAFPLIFGDLSGYWIVQKYGLTIVRFQDSATGINKVEYHVRRRVGGRVVEPWKFAVQEVAA